MAKITMDAISETARDRKSRDAAELEATSALKGEVKKSGFEKDTTFLFRTQQSRKQRMHKLALGLSKLQGRKVSIAEVLEAAFNDYEAKWQGKVSGQ